ncbi:hypothetical protein [Shimia aestuarii]|uniref:hypothetical protein n=1 Tax=Shimia aestuarii TaxID=254406 RepID=UPI001FB1CD1A|nr:hypothetical protein [Shimia aestuarii]
MTSERLPDLFRAKDEMPIFFGETYKHPNGVGTVLAGYRLGRYLKLWLRSVDTGSFESVDPRVCELSDYYVRDVDDFDPEVLRLARRVCARLDEDKIAMHSCHPDIVPSPYQYGERG